ncbi:uncharacterized protein LOC131019427 [Salvia miltiorrhiza]|uniref:uncharacterized protein LOC131019427 n=1 Tax=Salvia miltiorrhiza TaxID=226208 RepID=UPI0025AD1A94|nr:uncharacterized protein LOC131019427 [Salvia miltiorrhiza]
MHTMFLENKRETEGPKLQSGFVSPINLMSVAGSRRSRSVFDPYASDSSDSPSPLMKFLRSVDPAAGGASSPGFVTPVKVEEDVIVMDGISVPKSNKGSGEVRLRLPLMSSNSVNCSYGKSNSTGSSSSSGSGGRRSGVENSKSYKNRVCHFWETSGICQFGSECQFAHGKEELRHHRWFPGKIKLEISKLNSSIEGSSPSPTPSPHGSKFLRNSQVKAAAAAGEEAFSLPSLSSLSPIPAKLVSGTSAIPNTALLISEWTPQVDGIEATLPCVGKSPPKEDVSAYIESILYGAKTKKRLPVFVEICPDSC